MELALINNAVNAYIDMDRKIFKKIQVLSWDFQDELGKLYAAWQDYAGGHFSRIVSGHRRAVSACIFFLMAAVTMLLFRNVLAGGYSKAYQSASFFSPLQKSFTVIMGGSLAGMVLRFLRKQYYSLKLLLDRAIAAVSLIVLSPLFGLIALLIKLDSPGPVFFRQERLGEKGERFRIWKFRTMRQGAENETGPVWAQDADPRITQLGNFLRKSHIDEIPQFINIVRGEMALIGPRPERPELADYIKKHIPQFDTRLRVKPGVTGLAQSRYNYGASVKDAARKLKYDTLYIKRMCWMLDLQIAYWTVGRVLTGRGAR